jgi:peptidoglycan lytic transglycosylase G
VKTFFRWLMAITAVLVVVIAGVVGYGYYLFTRPGPLETSRVVFIPKGAGVDQITTRLHKAKVIGNRFSFKIWIRVYGAHGRLKAGEYRFPRSVSQKGAMQVLTQGKQILRRVTIPEGWTTYQILARIRRNPGLKGTVTLSPKEGSLLPDTYLFVRGETRDQLIRRMQKAMTTVVSRAWARRQPGLPLRSRREAVILASIIEKETSKKAERKRVSGVFINRLRKGMRLETDPTVIYSVTGGKGPLGRRLLRKDLRRDHPYNTYRNKGLPPGPIANPGKAAIVAAVNPMAHEEFYFVADGTGGHAFAKTFKEHKKNVRNWRKIRRKLEKKRTR